MGESVGEYVGPLGALEGEYVGPLGAVEMVGLALGDVVGVLVGTNVGSEVGVAVVGSAEGGGVGVDVGPLVGPGVGAGVGSRVEDVGYSVGPGEGCHVVTLGFREMEGLAVGADLPFGLLALPLPLELFFIPLALLPVAVGAADKVGIAVFVGEAEGASEQK